jgi:hypothetical protein
MTSTPPDPNPATTPGLTRGGGVEPGETPPDSAQTSGLSAPNRVPSRKMTPTAVVSLVAIVLLVLLFLATVALLFMP